LKKKEKKDCNRTKAANEKVVNQTAKMVLVNARLNKKLKAANSEAESLQQKLRQEMLRTRRLRPLLKTFSILGARKTFRCFFLELPKPSSQCGCQSQDMY
jgi:dynactin complex subunit